MKYSLKTKLSLTIALVVLLTVALISLLVNFFIGNQFKEYIANQQKETAQEIVNSISKQYDKTTNTWNINLIHIIGMEALEDGYIVKVYNLDKQSIWNAEICDMQLCYEVMDDISSRMMIENPKSDGEFISNDYPAMKDGEIIGKVQISYYGPYFFSKDDLQFLNSINRILIYTGIISLIISILVGNIIAKHLNRPIMKTVKAANQIANGDYGIKIEEDYNTKEVEQLIGAINHLSIALDTQEKLRRQLTEDVAHELRTPLTTVQTHIEAFIEEVWEPNKENLESCYDEMTRICKLVSDLEKLAKIQSDNLKLDKTKVSLLELSNKALKTFGIELKNKKIQAFVSGDCQEIFADKDRISQVLINLISNSIKYTPEGGKIIIRISQTIDFVIFSIEDNGIGIAEDEIPFIFERFYRADKSRNRMTGGAGIGLTIVKSIVAAHGGDVQVQSMLGKGSCFKVILPKSDKI